MLYARSLIRSSLAVSDVQKRNAPDFSSARGAIVRLDATLASIFPLRAVASSPFQSYHHLVRSLLTFCLLCISSQHACMSSAQPTYPPTIPSFDRPTPPIPSHIPHPPTAPGPSPVPPSPDPPPPPPTQTPALTHLTPPTPPPPQPPVQNHLRPHPQPSPSPPPPLPPTA